MPQVLSNSTPASFNRRHQVGLVAFLVLTVLACYAAVRTFAATNTVAGLSATYYDNADLSGKTVSRIDPNIAFNWSANNGGAPATGIDITTWSARWTGTITAPSTGTYQFSTLSDDGVRAWIGDQQVVNSWTDHSGFTDAGSVRLVKGTQYPIKVEYYQNSGADRLTLYWKKPGVSRVVIPSTALNTVITSGPTPTPVSTPTPSPTPSSTPAPTPTPTPTATPVASGSCATSTSHVPDGPDGKGGCWPGPGNTGPNAAQSSMAAYTGSCTISTANVTIDSKVINCSPLNVGSGASGLLIKNSYVLGGVIQNSGSASFTIQDSIIDNAVSRPACTSGTTCPAGKYACGDLNNGTTQCGIGYKNFTILRSEVMHSNRGAYCESACTIQDSYFHGTNLWPDKTDNVHASGVRNEQYLTLRHNSLGCDYEGPFLNDDIGCSADVSGYPDFAPIMHDTIDSNLFLSNNIGTGFCVYGGGTAGKPSSNDPANATYIVFTNNVFQRGANGKCGAYGPVTDFITGRTGNVWTDNKYDNGTTVPAN